MRFPPRNGTHTTVLTTAVVAGLACSGAHAQAQGQSPEEEHFYVSEQYVYDDNLFRISGQPAPDATLDPTLAREDYINRITAGVGEDVDFGRQTLRVKGRAQDVRFSENDQLDHIAGDAALGLQWHMLDAWSGTLTGGYNRALADFANLRTTAKDLVDTTSYGGSIRYQLGPRWALSAYGRHMSTEHSLQARQVDDVDADMERFAIDYVTPSQHTFGLEYRHARAEFPNFIATEFDTRGPQYEENAALAHISYNATVHTRLGATFGYVDRTRPDGFEGGYSGDTWRAEIDWHPRQKFSTLLSAWHEIKAYSDAESDYFIADGVSIAPEWKPLQTISISIAVSYEEQDYIGSNLLLDQTSARADDVLGAQTTFVYSPRPNLELQLQYQYFDRDSNRDWRRYDAQVAGASIRWRVM